ncbi:MAG TPA: cobyrinate a,c-diamide synthase, partial [Fibrobacteria bacterium]|nr:cobyrinate a,c-diamide synthase [Fibrobacteria bacterium]
EYARRRHPGLRWAGVIFNRVGSEGHYQRLRAAVSDMEVLGYLPRDSEYTLPERHLGLAVAEEGPIGPEGLRALAAAAEKHVDVPRLLQLAGRGHASYGAAPKVPDYNGVDGVRPRIAVARDRAFCFLYRENLDFLEEAGVELVYFSPLAGEPLPSRLDGLYLGGGYPELYAPTLSDNQSLREAIVRFADEGGAVYAECGGLMYLSRALVDAEGRGHPMCGLLPFETRMRTRRVALGYREVELKTDTLLGRKGQRLRGHEFHYSEAVDVPDSLERLYRVWDNRGDTLPEEGYRSGSVLASYIHLHFGSFPEAARALCQALLSRLVAR